MLITMLLRFGMKNYFFDLAALLPPGAESTKRKLVAFFDSSVFYFGFLIRLAATDGVIRTKEHLNFPSIECLGFFV